MGAFQILITGILLMLNSGVAEDSFGTYRGNVDAYEIVINETPIQVSASVVTIEIKSNSIAYKSEGLELEGDYEVVKSEKKYQFLKANMSNGKSLRFEMYFKVHEKGKTVIITDEDFTEEKGVLERHDQ